MPVFRIGPFRVFGFAHEDFRNQTRVLGLGFNSLGFKSLRV